MVRYGVLYSCLESHSYELQSTTDLPQLHHVVLHSAT